MIVKRYLVKNIIDHGYLGNDFDSSGKIRFVALLWAREFITISDAESEIESVLNASGNKSLTIETLYRWVPNGY